MIYMCIVYNDIGLITTYLFTDRKICEMYENAVKIDSSNEELHTQLFMSYVRISDFKLQQQSAMTLYKQKPKNPYYCWAVMSTVLQVSCLSFL